MNTENTLIDRYIHEVGQRLPKKLRGDIQLELRSALQDMLDERKLDALSANDEDAISQMLIEFGRPEKVASGYLPKHSVIGPQLFPAFRMAVKIAAVVLLALFSIGLGLDIANEGLSLKILANSLSQLYGSLFQMLGVVLVVFLILERFGVAEEEEEKDWDPQKLPKVDDRSRINRTELIVGLIFTSAALVIFNFFPEIFAIYASTNGEWSIVPLLAPEFSAHIPWLSVFWALELGLRTEVLRQGIWKQGTRVAEFMLSIFGIFVLYRIVIGGPILTISLLNSLVRAALTIALIVSIFEALAQVYRLIARPSVIPNQIAKTS